MFLSEYPSPAISVLAKSLLDFSLALEISGIYVVTFGTSIYMSNYAEPFISGLNSIKVHESCFSALTPFIDLLMLYKLSYDLLSFLCVS